MPDPAPTSACCAPPGTCEPIAANMAYGLCFDAPDNPPAATQSARQISPAAFKLADILLTLGLAMDSRPLDRTAQVERAAIEAMVNRANRLAEDVRALEFQISQFPERLKTAESNGMRAGMLRARSDAMAFLSSMRTNPKLAAVIPEGNPSLETCVLDTLALLRNAWVHAVARAEKAEQALAKLKKKARRTRSKNPVKESTP